MLAKLTCWHSLLWTWTTTSLANILDFERLFESKWLTDESDGSSTAKSQMFRWEDEDIERLIDLYKARPCHWDIADPTYFKKDVREKALSEIKEELDIEINKIKS